MNIYDGPRNGSGQMKAEQPYCSRRKTWREEGLCHVSLPGAALLFPRRKAWETGPGEEQGARAAGPEQGRQGGGNGDLSHNTLNYNYLTLRRLELINTTECQLSI